MLLVRRGPLITLALAVGALLGSEAGWASTVTVTYRSEATVYVDGGRQAGLSVGDRLAIESGKKTVAELEVVYVAERSASCKLLREERPVKVGDKVRIVRSAEPTTPVPPAPSPAPTPRAPVVAVPAPAAVSPAAPPSRPWARVAGGLSLGTSRAWDRSESQIDVEQRMARADLRVWDIAGKPLSFSVRASSRQTLRSGGASPFLSPDQRNDRLYEAALRYEPPRGRLAFELGRIGASRFVGIGYLDGGLVSFRLSDRVRLGGFVGATSNVSRLGFSGSGTKYGGYVRYSPGGASSWSATDAMLAYARETAGGDVSREYVSLESRFRPGTRLNLFQRAEVDLNSGWRQELSGKQVQLSLLSLAARLRLTTTASAALSYDSRRNYRTQLNRSVQEEFFDRLLRQGMHATLSVSRGDGLGFNVNLGALFTEQSEANTYSVGAGLRHARLAWQNLSASLDVAGYTNPSTEGGMINTSLARRFSGGHVVDLSYGLSLYRLQAQGLTRTSHWLRMSGWAQLPHRLYLAPDLGLAFGDDAQGPRGGIEMGWRF